MPPAAPPGPTHPDGAPAPPAAPCPIRLRLFIAGASPRSMRVVSDLRDLCTHGRRDLDLEVIDIYQQPHLAARHRVVAAPTLIRFAPEPVRRLVGDLSDRARLAGLLDVPPDDGREDVR